MSLFKEYATSIAFRVDLTKAMAATLWCINEYELAHRRGETPFGITDNVRLMIGRANVADPFTASSRSLLRRGLVEWEDQPKLKSNPKLSDQPAQTWKITEAGRHVLALCQLAEIVPQSSAVPVKKLRRAA